MVGSKGFVGLDYMEAVYVFFTFLHRGEVACDGCDI
jgi:hypothetical protein